MISLLKKMEDLADRLYAVAEQRVNSVSDKVLLLILSAFYFVWRILTLPMFEFGGDAVWKWRFLRYYHEFGTWFPLQPDHHQGRWAINFPVAWLMDLFGSSALWIGAVLPVLYGFFTILLIWFITRSIGSKLAALAASISAMMYFVFFTESAQFLPALPCTMYTLLALYLFLLYLKHPERLYFPLIAGLSMGLAWGCKVTVCYWCIGIALFLMFFPVPGKNLFCFRKLRIGWDLILFSLGFLLIFIPEFFLINHYFHVSMGRFSMLGGHLDVRLGYNAGPYRYNLIQYLLSPVLIFLNFSGKAINKVPFCMLFLLVLPPLFFQLRDKSAPLYRRFPAFMLLVAAMCHCYFVAHVFPFQHPERPLPRYFLTLSCLAFIVLYTAPQYLPKLRDDLRIPLRFLYGVLFSVLFAFMIGGWINDPLINGDHLFNKVHAYSCIQMQKEENLPLLIRYKSKREFDSRTFKVAMLWKTALSEPAENARLLEKKTEDWLEIWAKQEPVVDSAGIPYFLLAGPRPAAGSKADCIVVKESLVKRQTVQIAGPGGKGN